MNAGLKGKWFFGPFLSDAVAAVADGSQVAAVANGSELIELSSADSTACGVVASFLAWLE